MGKLLTAALVALLCGAPGGAARPKLVAAMGEGGALRLQSRAPRMTVGVVSVGAYGPDWTGVELSPREGSPQRLPDGAWQYAGELRPAGQAGRVAYTVTATARGREVELAYRFEAHGELRLNALFLRLRLPYEQGAGRAIRFGDRRLVLPRGSYRGRPSLYSGRGKTVLLEAAATRVEFRLSEEAGIEVEDNREWGDDSFSLSFHLFHGDTAVAIPEGRVFEQRLALRTEAPMETRLEPEAQSRTDTTGWFAFEMPRDTDEVGFSGAVDFSASVESPAGKRGFLTTKGEHFAFADGTPVEFWGVNLDTGACLPPKEQAPRIARRMAQVGINLARFVPDGPVGTGIIAGGNDTQHLDAELLDRMDYFVACLKEVGIYSRLDLMHYRKFRPGDGVDAPEDTDCGGPAMYFDPQVEKLHRGFAQKLLLHVNPYTKLRYVDDPAVAFLGIVNENSIFFYPERTTESGRRKLEGAFGEWQQAHPQGGKSEFLAELEERYYTRRRDFLRELGVKTPIACSNMVMNGANAQLQARVGDHVELNAYWDHPHRDYTWVYDRPMATDQGGLVLPLAAAAAAGKPFAITEINFCDLTHRSEAPLLVAAYAALQDWDAILWWEYASDWEGANAYAPRAGTTPMFSVRENPMVLAQFGVASLAFRHGYVSPGKRRVEVKLSGAEAMAEPGPLWRGGWNELTRGNPLGLLALVAQVRARYDESPGRAPDLTITGAMDRAESARGLRTLGLEALANTKTGLFRSDTGELSWDTPGGVLTIDTPRLQAAIGFVGGKSFTLGDFRLDLRSQGKPSAEFAAVSLCSLDGRPLEESSRLLLTAVGRAEDTGQVWREGPEGDLAAVAGAAPALAEPVVGEFRWQGRRLRAFPLTPAGQRRAEVLVREAAGGAVLPMGEAGTLWYELVPG